MNIEKKLWVGRANIIGLMLNLSSRENSKLNYGYESMFKKDLIKFNWGLSNRLLDFYRKDRVSLNGFKIADILWTGKLPKMGASRSKIINQQTY
jgi:hypothetical protein